MYPVKQGIQYPFLLLFFLLNFQVLENKILIVFFPSSSTDFGFPGLDINKMVRSFILLFFKVYFILKYIKFFLKYYF